MPYIYIYIYSLESTPTFKHGTVVTPEKNLQNRSVGRERMTGKSWDRSQETWLDLNSRHSVLNCWDFCCSSERKCRMGKCGLGERTNILGPVPLGHHSRSPNTMKLRSGRKLFFYFFFRCLFAVDGYLGGLLHTIATTIQYTFSNSQTKTKRTWVEVEAESFNVR